VQFTAIGVAALIIVALAMATASRRVGQREAISDARTTALILAQGLVEPVVTDGLVVRDPAAVAQVGKVVEESVIDGSLVRVKIWTATGLVVYSNDHAIEGRQYELDAGDLESLRSGLIEAEVSNLDKPENAGDRRFGKLLEVYLPIRTPSGERLLFEAYFRHDSVAAKGGAIWESFAPIALGSLVILELLQIPIAWSLARRLQQRQREREALLHRALDASDVERRRIANDLHDGMVQDLAGIAFSLAATARDEGITSRAGAALEDASNAVRGSITALRATLVDIYPPNLAEDGLLAALRDLAAAASSDTLDATVHFDMPYALPQQVAGLLFRAARGALRNVAEHAEASTAQVNVGGDKRVAWLEVVDDGVGFDPGVLEERAEAGHLGLTSLRDVVQDSGGRFAVDSAAGRGTTVRVEVPIS
jgi:signal transduction histidine kinase